MFKPVALLGIWTLIVWLSRVRNIFTDDTLSGSERIAPLVVAVGFSVAAVMMLAFRGSRHSRPIARVVALVTVVYWIVRGFQIGFADHSAGFIVVHSVLAAVSVGLGAWVLGSKR